MVVYGNTSGTGNAVVYGLSTSNIVVTYSNFGVKRGQVAVTITGYQFRFAVPLIGATVTLPDYKTSLTGESAGYTPPNI